MMNKLTNFQKKCEEELKKHLDNIGVVIENRKILEGDKTWFADKQTFVEASIGRITIWIYDDEAYIKGKDIEIPFESPDYNSEDELIKAFVEKVISIIKWQLEQP